MIEIQATNRSSHKSFSCVFYQQEIINPDSTNVWKTIHSQVRLIHTNTSQAVKVFVLGTLQTFLQIWYVVASRVEIH